MSVIDYGKKALERGLNIAGNTLDRSIGIISPAREVKRLAARRQVLSARQYAAAKVSRTGGDWFPVDQDVNSIIRNSSGILRSRTRQLVRDFPYFNRAISNLVNYTVGPGIKFQSRVTDANGKYDKNAIQQIEDAVKWAMEEMDVAGKLHFCEIEKLAKRQDVEAGELLFVKTHLKDKKRYIPFALQAYEADWLTSAYSKVEGKNQIDQGIEFDPATGRVIAYHFAVPSGYNSSSLTGSTKTTRVPAEYVIHNFNMLRPGQLRGVSPFTAAILIAHDLGDYLDAEIDGAKMAAKWLAFVTTDKPAEFQNMRTAAGTGADAGKKIEEIENATIEYLRTGEKIEIAKHNRPGNAFPEFTKFCLRMVAISTDTTYELLSGDYDGISYSNLRGIRNDYAVMIKPHSQRHILHFTKPVIEEIITSAVLAGRINLPGFWRNPRHYFKGLYTPPGMESIDPLREGKAWIEQINAKLRSPQEITAGRGRDFEEVLDEIADSERMMKDRGLSMAQVSTALKQNPAALKDTKLATDKEEAADDSTDDSVNDTNTKTSPADLKTEMDAYGIGVRAGVFTPQAEDEEHFRSRADLPEATDTVKTAWEKGGGTKSPVTLKSGVTAEAEQEKIAGKKSDESETDGTTDATDNAKEA